MEKTERLLDLVALLLGARDPVPPEVLRESFPNDYGGPTREAGDRKLERDKAELIGLGVPVEWVPPADIDEPGGYRIDRKAFFLADPKLTPEETAALYAAGAAALSGRDFPFAQDLGHALRKISLSGSGLPSQQAQPGATTAAVGAAAARRLLIVRPGDPARGGKLRALGDAVARKKRVHLAYRAAPGIGAAAAPEQTLRDVDPYGLAFRGGAWRLVAFCHLRQALRVFVVDRIESLAVSDVRPNQTDFEIPEGFDAGALAGTRPWRWIGSQPVQVTLRFAPGSELLAERAFDAPGEILDPAIGGGARLSFEVTWVEGLVPHVLSFGDRVWVSQPESVRQRLVASLTELERRLSVEPELLSPESDPPPPLTLSQPPPSRPPMPQPGPASGPGAPSTLGHRDGEPRVRRSRSVPSTEVVAPEKRERLRRLLLIVPAARRRPGIKLEELARELGLDPADLIADIDLLSVVGRPPFNPDDLIDISVDEQGRVTVSLDQSFSRPPQLTVLEALALSAAAREAAPADPAVLSALEKLTGSLPAAARQLYRALALRVDTAAPPPAGTPALLATLRTAAEGHREVVLEYDKDGATAERPLQPWAVIEHQGRWYVVGFDLTRKAERLFRLDRIRAVRETGESFVDPGPVDLARFERDELFFPSGREQPITLRFQPGTAAWALSRWGQKARKLRGGAVEIAIESAGPAYAVSLALGFAGEAEVIDPPSARAAMRDEVARTLARYRSLG